MDSRISIICFICSYFLMLHSKHFDPKRHLSGRGKHHWIMLKSTDLILYSTNLSFVLWYPPNRHMIDNNNILLIILVNLIFWFRYNASFGPMRLGGISAACLSNLGSAEPKLKDFLIKCKHFTRSMLSGPASTWWVTVGLETWDLEQCTSGHRLVHDPHPDHAADRSRYRTDSAASRPAAVLFVGSMLSSCQTEQ